MADIADNHVHHRDGDPGNDMPENLELVSPADHCSKHPDNARGERSTKVRKRLSEIQKQLWADGAYSSRRPRKSKYSWALVLEIQEALKKGETQASISKRLKVPSSTIWSLLRKAETHGSDVFL